jgi:hypothetical protein
MEGVPLVDQWGVSLDDFLERYKETKEQCTPEDFSTHIYCLYCATSLYYIL